MKNILIMLAVMTLLVGLPARAEVLIKINVEDLDAVEIYAVAGAKSAVTDDSHTKNSGITLLDVLTEPVDDFGSTDLNGTLTSAGELPQITYNRVERPTDFESSLNLYHSFAPANDSYQEFTSGGAAFSGASIVGEAFLDRLPLKGVGATGDIVAGYRNGAISEVIGQWQIVNDSVEGGRISLEEPVEGLVHGGIGNLRGFAFFDADVERIEVYLDGEYVFDAPYGGSREDVAAAFPDFANARNSGYSLAYGYSNLSSGEHTIRVVAVGADGALGEDSATFTVVRFLDLFIAGNAIVDGSDAQISMDGDEIAIESIQIGQDFYSLLLKWRTAEQGFEIIEIVAHLL